MQSHELKSLPFYLHDAETVFTRHFAKSFKYRRSCLYATWFCSSSSLKGGDFFFFNPGNWTSVWITHLDLYLFWLKSYSATENQTPLSCGLFHTENVFNFLPICSRRRDGLDDFQRKPVKPPLIYGNHGRPVMITEKVYLSATAPHTPLLLSLHCSTVCITQTEAAMEHFNLRLAPASKSKVPDARSCRTVLYKLQLKVFSGGWIYWNANGGAMHTVQYGC